MAAKIDQQDVGEENDEDITDPSDIDEISWPGVPMYDIPVTAGAVS